MFKSIPKSSISKRQFKTYKEWRVNNTEYPVISASLDNSFILDNDITSSFRNTTFYSQPLYKSIRSKYYNSNGSFINTYGVVENLANYSIERKISNTIRIISLDRDKYGEQIKQGSVSLTDIDSDVLYIDDSYGGLRRETFDYVIEKIDLQNETIILKDNFQSYELSIFSIDFGINEAVLIFEGDTNQYIFVSFDIQIGVLRLPFELSQTGGLILENVRYGNVFYDEGLIVLTNEQEFKNYNLVFNSTQTIYESEVLVNVDEGEFNYSQNPTAVETLISGSYYFRTTPIGRAYEIDLIDKGDDKLRYEIYRYTGSIPNNSSQMDSVFNGLKLDSGNHNGKIFFGTSDQTVTWGGQVQSLPDYFPTSTYLGWIVDGFIYAPESGSYTFQLDSDNASDMFVNGQLVVDYYGNHTFGTNLGNRNQYSITLQEGWHPIKVRLQQELQQMGIAVGWQKPSDSSITTVPDNYFSSFKPTRENTIDPNVLGPLVKIDTIKDKRIKQSFSGSYNPSITGSWDDYQNYRWSDPTGSYLTPYITTIGLYDDDNNLLVVAKLPTPIKSFPDLPINFLIRFDT